MSYQNVTLSIPKTILQKAKLIAVQRETSLSKLLTQALTDIVENEDRYADARRRQLALLDRSPALNTQGIATWTREELHER